MLSHIDHGHSIKAIVVPLGTVVCSRCCECVCHKVTCGYIWTVWRLANLGYAMFFQKSLPIWAGSLSWCSCQSPVLQNAGSLFLIDVRKFRRPTIPYTLVQGRSITKIIGGGRKKSKIKWKCHFLPILALFCSIFSDYWGGGAIATPAPSPVLRHWFSDCLTRRGVLMVNHTFRIKIDLILSALSWLCFGSAWLSLASVHLVPSTEKIAVLSQGHTHRHTTHHL